MQKVITQFELVFWNWYIPVFSQSTLVRKCLPWLYKISRKSMLATYLAAVCVMSSGFLSGIILYYLTNR